MSGMGVVLEGYAIYMCVCVCGNVRPSATGDANLTKRIRYHVHPDHRHDRPDTNTKDLKLALQGSLDLSPPVDLLAIEHRIVELGLQGLLPPVVTA